MGKLWRNKKYKWLKDWGLMEEFWGVERLYYTVSENKEEEEEKIKEEDERRG